MHLKPGNLLITLLFLVFSFFSVGPLLFLLLLFLILLVLLILLLLPSTARGVIIILVVFFRLVLLAFLVLLVAFASLINRAQAHARLVRRILEDEGRQLVHVVELPGPAAGIASALDDAFLDEHVDLGQVTVLAADILLNELVQRSAQVLHLVGSPDNGALALSFLVGVRRLSTQVIAEELCHVLRRALDGTSDLSHVHDARLDSIPATLDLRHKPGHLVAVLRVGVRGRNVAHRHGCDKLDQDPCSQADAFGGMQVQV
mmetsp:Transcript_59661/g.139593  ORF Transcript_59661/g.139593 Transcript_59661/m.139593 type:complete len:259 (+) Transcript_59661:617-1393(+)